MKVLWTRNLFWNFCKSPITSNKIAVRFCYIVVGRLQGTIGFEAMAINGFKKVAIYTLVVGQLGPFQSASMSDIFQEQNAPSIKNWIETIATVQKGAREHAGKEQKESLSTT